MQYLSATAKKYNIINVYSLVTRQKNNLVVQNYAKRFS